MKSMKSLDKSDVMANLQRTRKLLENYPIRARLLGSYFKELEERLAQNNSAIWIAYQNERLDRIRWLVDKDDDGMKKGMRLMVRPYDIPWIIYGLAEKTKPGFQDQYNGWVENMEKMAACPAMEIEFTDKFADFCKLCQHLLADGCTLHPDFGDYGKIFPQPNQMNKKLRENCEWVLGHLGLKWDSVVNTRTFFSLCVQKIPDPAAFKDFPEISEINWGTYREGIKIIKNWLDQSV